MSLHDLEIPTAVQEIAKSIIGDQTEFLKKIFKEERQFTYYNSQPLRAVLKYDGARGETIFWIGNDFLKVLGFSFRGFPSCCGIKIFHNFTYRASMITEEQVHQVLSAFFGKGHTNNRFLVTMVSNRGAFANTKELREAMAQSLPEVENEQVFYQWYKTWFEKQHKCKVLERVYNKNSGNTLHLIEFVI